MFTQIFKDKLKSYALIILISAMISCNSNNQTVTKDNSNVISEKEVIPDTIIQFLITSASKDFHSHQPPTAIDVRNVRIGYLSSAESKKMFLLCGEFLSKESKQWVEFTTIKTSGYEQYLGKTQYCQEATFVLTDESLSMELKKKLTD